MNRLMDEQQINNESVSDDGFYEQFKPVVAGGPQVSVAKQWLAAGVSVLHTRIDGSKAPAGEVWEPLQLNRMTDKEAEKTFRYPCGIGVIGGPVSGNLATLDIERSDIADKFEAALNECYPGLLPRLAISETPGSKSDLKGRHYRWKCDSESLSSKPLARTPEGKTLIEVKANGGYTVAPGSDNRTHAKGTPYRWLQGGIESIPTINTDEQNLLVSVAQSFNEFIKKEKEYTSVASHSDGERPGDKYNATGDFSPLFRHGSKVVGRSGGVIYVQRPGKEGPGLSGTIGHCRGQDGTLRFYPFSSDYTPFEVGEIYSPFAVLAMLDFGGDYSAAARSLSPASPRNDSSQATHHSTESAADKPEAWERPIPLDSLPAAMKFPISYCPPVLADIASEVAESMRGPIDFAGTAAIMTAATLIGSTRELMLKRSTGWYASPRGYAALVGRSGGVKSPILRFFKKALEQRQETLSADFETKKAAFELEKEEWEIARKQAKDAKEACKTLPPIAPAYGRILTDNFTVESLCPILKDNPRGVGAVKDELTSLFMSLNQYKGGKGDDRQFFLSVHGGETIMVDRKSFGGVPIVVKRPFLVICGGLPPSFLSEMQDTKNRQDGMLERFFYAYPDDPPIEGWNESAVRETVRIKWEKLGNDLLRFSHRATPDGLMPELLMFSKEGKEAWDEEFERNVEEMRHPDFCQDSFRAYWEKANGYAGNLALILESIKSADSDSAPSPEVSVESVRSAWRLMDYFKNSFRRVASHLNTSSDVAKAQKVLSWISRHKPQAFQRGDVHNHLKHSNVFAKIESLDEPLTRLIAHGYIREIGNEQDNQKRRGRPRSATFQVNPGLWSSAA